VVLEPDADLVDDYSRKVQQRKVEPKSDCHLESALHINSVCSRKCLICDWLIVTPSCVARVLQRFIEVGKEAQSNCQTKLQAHENDVNDRWALSNDLKLLFFFLMEGIIHRVSTSTLSVKVEGFAILFDELFLCIRLIHL
jgi:hypothetical protein